MSSHKPDETYQAKQAVGQYDPIYYAGASGDFNPIHIDPKFGKMVGLGGNILQGLCTMAYVAKTAVNFAGGDPGNLKKIKVRFAKPVRPEDTITINLQVREVGDEKLTADMNAVTQNGEEVITKAWVELKSS